MSVLSRIETALESVFEGSFRRLFNSRLQPIEIAHAIERAMFDAKVVGPVAAEVPGHYVVRMSPTDYESFREALAAHERSLAAFIDRRADEEGLRPVGRIAIDLERDPTVPRSVVRVEVRWDQPPIDRGLLSADRTRRFERVTDQRSRPTLQIEAEDGQALTARERPVRLGRAADNDLVVRDIRVSRYHAALEPASEGWVVRDLKSTNGTFVDGERVDAVSLRVPTVVSLGGFRINIRAL